MDILFSSISPFVRYIDNVRLPNGRRLPMVNTYDHRLFYIVSGTAIIHIYDKEIAVGPGHVLYWMSGTPYNILPTGHSDLQLIAINFDFTQNHSTTIQYLPVTPIQEYIVDKRLEVLQFADAPVMNHPVHLSNVPEIASYLQIMLQETTSPNTFGNAQLSAFMHIVLIAIYREVSSHQTQKQKRGLKDILAFIHLHYTEDLTNQKLAALFGYHPNYISHLIRNHTGVPLHQYLLQLRIHQTLHLLQTTDLPIYEIACKVGFQNPSYFSQYFKQCTGYSPSAFRNG